MDYYFDKTTPPQIKSGHLKLGGSNNKGEEITLNNRYLIRNGKPWIPVMGEIHFSRLDPKDWEDELLKMKAGGVCLISTYVFWIYHEEIEGEMNFTGACDVGAFVRLCKKCGLDVVLRIGPWAHGECRNGGFPDWLLKKEFPLRQNHPEYLKLAEGWYRAVEQQVRGLLYQDGGPIVAVQLENELTDQAEHLRKLKEIAIKVGLTVPLYTVTGWNSVYGARIPQEEVLPVFGGYPEAPWTGHTKQLEPSPHFFFHHMRNDSAIGTDLLPVTEGEQEELPYTDYPFATCELGGGIEVTQHRRPKISGEDIYSISLVKIGDGNNLPGYYMYHGGTNQMGKKSTFQESKASGYPNDCLILSYDFQAALGEYGLLRPQYRMLKGLHQFLNNFMEEFAPMDSFLQAEPVVDPHDTSSLRYAMRTDGKAGFVFVNNYQRLTTLAPHKQVRFCVPSDGKEFVFPEKGMSISEGESFFVPFQWEIGGQVLDYATAQPICRQGNTFFFMALSTVCEYCLEGQCVTVETPGLESGFEWGSIKIVTLTKDQALHCYQDDGQRVYVARQDLYFKGGQVVSYGNGPDLSYWKWNGEAFDFYPCFRSEERGNVLVQEISAPGFTSEHFWELEAGGARPVKQWSVKTDQKNGLLKIYYVGDVAQLYVDGKLVADAYYYGDAWEVPAALLEGKEAVLMISELKPDIYLETNKKAGLELEKIEYVPYYEETL